MDDKRKLHFENVMENYRLAFYAGDKSVLLEAIETCANFCLVMPDWVAYEFTISHRKWKTLKVKTLDEAFDVSRKKYFHINKERKWMNKAGDVFMEINSAALNGRPIDQNLMEDVAIKFGINRKDAWNMYEHIKNHTEIGKGFTELLLKKKDKKI